MLLVENRIWVHYLDANFICCLDQRKAPLWSWQETRLKAGGVAVSEETDYSQHRPSSIIIIYTSSLQSAAGRVSVCEAAFASIFGTIRSSFNEHEQFFNIWIQNIPAKHGSWINRYLDIHLSITFLSTTQQRNIFGLSWAALGGSSSVSGMMDGP